MIRLSASTLFGSAILAMISATTTAISGAFLALPTFDVPAFDYFSLESDRTPDEILAALQEDGIVAFKNVPNFANLRNKYLTTAAKCVLLAAESTDGDFVSRKLFDDGTKRLTINSNAGLQLPTAATDTLALCPGYRELYLEFSELVEHAVNTFASALDRTTFTASDGDRVVPAHKLVSEAVRLDHFHVYEAAPTKTEMTSSQHNLEYSLPVHEDHGLFIAMTAPKFFVIDGNRRLMKRHIANDASGLVIQTRSGQRVRPVLKEDEVVIMMGTGGSRWLETSHDIPAVMHGMKMPDAAVNDSVRRSLRAWFGKMTLLPSYQRLLANRDVTFDEHLNLTAQYVVDRNEGHLKTIGCAAGRHLYETEGSCKHRQCTTKRGQTAPEEGCEMVCNRKHFSDPMTCAEKCTCKEVTHPGVVCWMVCNKELDGCAMAQQSCNNTETRQLICNFSLLLATPAPTTETAAAITTLPSTVTTAPTASLTTSSPTPGEVTDSTTTVTPSSSVTPLATIETPVPADEIAADSSSGIDDLDGSVDAGATRRSSAGGDLLGSSEGSTSGSSSTKVTFGSSKPSLADNSDFGDVSGSSSTSADLSSSTLDAGAAPTADTITLSDSSCTSTHGNTDVVSSSVVAGATPSPSTIGDFPDSDATSCQIDDDANVSSSSTATGTTPTSSAIEDLPDPVDDQDASPPPPMEDPSPSEIGEDSEVASPTAGSTGEDVSEPDGDTKSIRDADTSRESSEAASTAGSSKTVSTTSAASLPLATFGLSLASAAAVVLMA